VIFFPQENLTSLLTDDEMQQLIENFDKLDVNQGNNMPIGKTFQGIIEHEVILKSNKCTAKADLKLRLPSEQSTLFQKLYKQ